MGGVVGGSGGGWGGGVAAGQAHNNNLPSQPQPPRIKKAHFHPGACLMHARRYETVLAVCPGCAEAHNNLGVLHREAGNMERAAACYQGALAARPGFPQVGGWGWMQLCPCCCRPCCCRRCSWGPAATAAAAPDAHSAFWQSHCEALRKPSAFHPCFLRALSLSACAGAEQPGGGLHAAGAGAGGTGHAEGGQDEGEGEGAGAVENTQDTGGGGGGARCSVNRTCFGPGSCMRCHRGPVSLGPTTHLLAGRPMHAGTPPAGGHPRSAHLR